MILTSKDDPEEFHRLTGKKRHSAIARALNTLGVAHIVRADGVVVVSQAHIEAVLGGTGKPGRSKKEPVLGVVN